MSKKHLKFSVAISSFLIFYGSFLSAKVVNKTVATVNNEIVTLEDFQKKANPLIEQYQRVYKGTDAAEKMKALKKELLGQMVDEKLLRQEAKRQNIVATKQDIEKGINEVKKRFGPENDYKDYKEELARQGYTEKSFEKDIKEQLMVMKLIEREVKEKVGPPTEEEIKKYYDDHKDEMKQPEQVKARHILIRVDEKADMKVQSAALKRIQEVREKVKKGDDFAALAKEYSEDPGSKENGGDLGYFSKETMVPEFSKVAFSLKPGEVSEVVKTAFGYHLIKVEEKKPAKELTLEDEVPIGEDKNVKVKDYLQNIAYQEKVEKKFAEWLKELKAKAQITLYEIE